MRAAVLASPRQVRIEQVPDPHPARGEIRVHVEGCGVCASSLGPWEGLPWLAYPFAPGSPGHEVWGHIDAVGPDVSPARVGERVAILSARGYAEYDVAPATRAVTLPEWLAGVPFPGEALGCAVNIFRRSWIAPNQTIAIVGIGFLGAILTRLCTAAGARVVAISRRPFARDVARQFGAAVTLGMADHAETIAAVHSLTDGRGCERVIEAVGMQTALDLATALTREQGRLIIAGYHQDGSRHVNMQLWNWRGLDVINAHERSPLVVVHGIRTALEGIRRGTFDPRSLYTHVFPLERVADALTATGERPPGFMKALVVP